MSCVNEKCGKNPLNSPNAICVNIDGDFACDEKCKAEYEKQKAYFFSTIVHSEKRTEDYLLGRGPIE